MKFYSFIKKIRCKLRWVKITNNIQLNLKQRLKINQDIQILFSRMKLLKKLYICLPNKMKMNEDIQNALLVLRKGGIILYPTDTVWGIGCDATNQQAVKRIYAIKQRSDAKAMLLLIDSPAKLPNYVADIPSIAWDLIDVAIKPLTIIYPGAKNLAPDLLAEDGSVGIRITNEKYSHLLCEQFRKPIVSTSANISGQVAPQNFSQIDPRIISAVDYVVKYRQEDDTKAAPSSIIKIGEGGTIQIIRQ